MSETYHFGRPAHKERVQSASQAGNVKRKQLQAHRDIPYGHTDAANHHAKTDAQRRQPPVALGVSPVAEAEGGDDGHCALAGRDVVDLARRVPVSVGLEVEAEGLAVGDHGLVEDDVEQHEAVPAPGLEDAGHDFFGQLDFGRFVAVGGEARAREGDLGVGEPAAGLARVRACGEGNGAEDGDGDGQATTTAGTYHVISTGKWQYWGDKALTR